MRGRTRLLIPAVSLLIVGPGCSRNFFRERADADVAGVITQKNHFPAWAVKNWHVYPHPDARYADPYNPDRPPYPPDDYAARLLSPNPQHPTKRSGTGRHDGDGYLRLLSQWDAENRGLPPAAVGAATPGPEARGSRSEAASAKVVALPGTVVAAGGARSTKAPLAPPSFPGKGVGGLGSAAAPASAVVPADVREKGGPQPVTQIKVVPVLQPPTVVPETPATPLPPIPRVPEKLPAPQAADPKAPGQPGEFPSIQTLIALGGTDADYQKALESNQQGFLIRTDQAVEMGLLNSREFQDRREDLYLAALPVTLERYNFAAQAFFAEQVVRNFAGSDLAGAGRLWSLDTVGGFTKNFSTGAALLVRMANQVVIDLGSSRPDIAVSNLTLSFVQPFLRGGGFAVNLEGLTQAERNMLYAMRSYARFRKIFYVAVSAGGNITNNPYGLQGLSVNLGRGIGGNLTSPSVGFLPLLQQSAVIANQRKNVSFLEMLLRQYQAFREGGQQSDLQVGQVEVQLLNSRGQLLGSAAGGGNSGIRGYLDQLDNFKLQLGLPVTVGLELDNTPLKPVRDQLARFEDLYADLALVEGAARRVNPDSPPAQFRAQWRRLLTESELVKGTAFAKGIGARWDSWARLTEDEYGMRVADIRKQRSALLDARAKRQDEGKPEPETEARRLAQLDEELDLAGFERALRVFESKPWTKPPVVGLPPTQASAFSGVLEAFYLVALDARNERVALVRSQWPSLPPLPVEGMNLLEASLDEAYTVGVQAALSNRLDLMNARGQVVDAYRQVAVQANSLQGVFDVQYDLNAATPAGDNRPFAFSSDRTRHTLTFRGELPLVRRAERNNYRAALIGYQRQRRTLMAFEDNIANDVRADIRELRTLAQLYRIQQRVVELGYSQVDNAQAILLSPPAPDARTDAGSAAALTQQVLDAQGRLLTAQNLLFTLWVNYLTARMNLYLDLELMQLDDRGMWCDEQATEPDSAARPGIGTRPAERLPAPQPVGPADRK